MSDLLKIFLWGIVLVIFLTVYLARYKVGMYDDGLYI